MGKYKAFLLFGIAIFVALIATVLIMNWLQRTARVRQVATPETQDIAIAKVDLKWGTVLAKEMIEMKPFLKKSLPGGYFPDITPLAGRVLVSPVKASEPILESRLAPTDVKTGGVAAVVSTQKRAVAVKVDQVIGVAGFVHPGNRVDVLVTITTGTTGKTSDSITKTVLENILVLAAGPEMATKGKEEKPAMVDVITLEVTPEEAEKLALAATEGKLQLALRNFSDTEDVMTRGTTIPTLLGSYSSAPGKETKPVPVKRGVASKKPAPVKVQAIPEEKKPEEKREEQKTEMVAAPVKKPPYVVELIKGNKSSEVKFEGSE